MSEARVDRSRRFAMIPEELLCDPDIPAGAVRVFGVLHRFGKTPDRCFPSMRAVAEMAGCSIATVVRHIDILEAAGWVRRLARRTPNGLKTSNGYELFDVARCVTGDRTSEQGKRKEPPGEADHSLVSSRSITGDNPDHSPVTTTDHSPVIEERESLERESFNERGARANVTSLSDHATETSPHFRRFSEAYPRPVHSNAGTLRAFRHALGHTPSEDIISGAEAYAGWVARTRENERFVDDPAEWLRERRWTTSYDPPRPEDSWMMFGASTMTMDELNDQLETQRRREADELGSVGVGAQPA